MSTFITVLMSTNLSFQKLSVQLSKHLQFAVKLIVANPVGSLSAVLLVVGVATGIVLTSSSTDIRQQAQMNPYVTCIDGSTIINGGVDAGGCRCSDGTVVDPGAHCPVSNPNPNPTATSPISSPQCLQDGQTIGQGGAVCCSGKTYQEGNNVICGQRANSTCTGSCVSSSASSCGAINRYSASGTCSEKVGENFLCCGTTLASSPSPLPSNTPQPSPICYPGQSRCQGSTSYSCYATNAETSTYCANGCDTNTGRCKQLAQVPSTIPTTIPKKTCYQYSAATKSCKEVQITSPSCLSIAGFFETYPSCAAYIDEQKFLSATPTPIPSPTIAKKICYSTPGCQGIPVSGNVCPSSSGFFEDQLECIKYELRLEITCSSKDTCVNGKWCGKDTKLTQINCQPGQKRCDDWSTGTCKEFTPTPTPSRIPTPRPVLLANCRTNQDCGLGYICLKDYDNSFSCQPEQKTKTCWIYNLNTNTCESFKSFAGIQCPIGSSPSSDICIHPTPQLASSQVNCIPNQTSNDSHVCVGNINVYCDAAGKTVNEICPGGCYPNGFCKPPLNGTCTVGTSWCDGNSLVTCEKTLVNPGAGSPLLSSSTTSERCTYGCDAVANDCYPAPQNLSYTQTLEQDLEKQYGININIGGTVSYSIGASSNKPITEASAYKTLINFKDTISTLPPSYVRQAISFEIMPDDDPNNITGYSLVNGFIAIQECGASISFEDCKHMIIHEIGHNNEEVAIDSSHCPDGKSCTSIEGFIIAAQNDSNPLYFLSSGLIDHGNSTILLDSYSAENLSEFFANYQAYYFDAPDKLKSAHPDIYDYLQDMHCEYRDQMTPEEIANTPSCQQN